MTQETTIANPKATTKVEDRAGSDLPKINQEVKFREILSQLVKDPTSLENINMEMLNERSFWSNLKSANLNEKDTAKFSNLNKDEALEALKENPFCYLALPKELREDKGFCKEALFAGVELYPLLPDSLQRDQDLINIEFRAGALSLEYISKDLLSDREFLKKIILANASCYCELPEKWRRDIELSKYALNLSPSLIADVLPDLLKEEELQVFISKISLASEKHMRSILGDSLCPEAVSFYDAHRKALTRLSLDENSFNWYESKDEKYRGAPQHPDRAFNFMEIVSGRFLVGDSQLKSELIEIYGRDYFKVNDKPLAVFIGHGAIKDKLSVINVMRNGYVSELDDMSINHQLVYYEISDKTSLSDSLKEGFGRLDKLPSTLIILNHGRQARVAIGDESPEGMSLIRSLQLSDREFQKSLLGTLPAGINIYLISCKTGAGELFANSIDNMAEYFQGIEPRNLVFAPKDSVDPYLDILDEKHDFKIPNFETLDGSAVEPLVLKPLHIYDLEKMSELIGDDNARQLSKLSKDKPGLLFGIRDGSSSESLCAFYFGKTIFEVQTNDFKQESSDNVRQCVEREVIRETIISFSAERYPDEEALSFEKLSQSERNELVADLSSVLGREIESLDFTFAGGSLRYDVRQAGSKPTRVAVESKLIN